MTSDPRGSNNSDARKRSRSPYRDPDDTKDVKRHRSRSPHRHHHRHRSRDRAPKATLPYKSQHLHKHDFNSYRTLFTEYLDLQKGLDIDELTPDEVKGRWKSFLGKWNRGELAEGWYDPETKGRVDERASATGDSSRQPKVKRETSAPVTKGDLLEHEEEDDDDDDGFGPALPKKPGGAKRIGPTVPNTQDLQYKREVVDEDRQAARSDLRYERRQDRVAQKERLEELVPKAAPGSRERQLEKKRDTAASNKAFAEQKEAGAEEVGEGDLMGEEGGGVEGFKAKVKERARAKNEREIRKEETLRARAAEREERLVEHRRREEKTMDMLRELARARFGGEA